MTTSGTPHKPGNNGTSLTVDALARAKALPADWLRDLGLADLPDGGVAIPYHGPDGATLFVRQREVPGGPRFRQPGGTPLQPYGLDRLAAARKHGHVYYVEGESDCWPLWHLGLPAQGLPGAGSARCLRAEHLDGIDAVYVHQECGDDGEPDQGGKQFVEGLQKRLGELEYSGAVYVIQCRYAGVKDPADLYARDPDRFLERWQAVVSAARPLAVGDGRGDAWEPPGPAASGAPPGDAASTFMRWRFAALDSRTFFTNKYELEWLVSRVLVAGQPGVIGGPKKVLKTSTLIDLAVSLGSATPFLGRFQVYRRRRVVILSGESGEAVLQNCGQRVCAARGVDPCSLDVFWAFRLPQLANPLDLRELRRGLEELCADVLVLDPLYLALLSGANSREVEAGNLYHMGPLLSDMAQACLEVKCTPLLCHHAGKARSNHFDPLDLDDLSFSGIAEYARQWILENRREPFDPNTGSHRLWVSVGGSAGQSGCWAMDVEEGVLREDFGGRKWDVTVYTLTEALEGEATAKDRAKRDAQARQVKEDGTRVLNALDTLADADGRAVFTQVRAKACLANDRMTRAVLALRDEGAAFEVAMKVSYGKGNKTTREARGLTRRNPTPPAPTQKNLGEAGPSGPSGQTQDNPDGPDAVGAPCPAGADHRDTHTPIGGVCPDGQVTSADGADHRDPESETSQGEKTSGEHPCSPEPPKAKGKPRRNRGKERQRR
jgi:replicative DNA helicase